MPIFMIGHVTKQGDLAGPRALEHIVDAVLFMEGERHRMFRLLRGIKNRYGRTDEVCAPQLCSRSGLPRQCSKAGCVGLQVAVFTMEETGLHPVTNPSALFMSDKSQPLGVGSAVCVMVEGTRPLLAEVQALCTKNYSQVCPSTLHPPQRQCPVLVLRGNLKLT